MPTMTKNDKLKHIASVVGALLLAAAMLMPITTMIRFICVLIVALLLWPMFEVYLTELFDNLGWW